MNRWRGRDFRHNAKWQMFQKVTWTWHNIGVSCWHFTALHSTAGGYMSQLAVNNRQDHLDANRSRRSIGCCNSCESQAGTPFRLARLKDKPLKLCLHLLVQSFRIEVWSELLQLYLQCIIRVRHCPVIFSSFLVVSCNQGAVRINDASLRLLLTVDDWGVPSCPDTSNVNESLPPLRPQHTDKDNVTADRSVAGALAAEWPSYLYAGDCYQGEKQTGLGRCLIGLEVAW